MIRENESEKSLISQVRNSAIGCLAVLGAGIFRYSPRRYQSSAPPVICRSILRSKSAEISSDFAFYQGGLHYCPPMSLSLEIAPENMAYKSVFEYSSDCLSCCPGTHGFFDAHPADAKAPICRSICLCNALNASVSRFR